MTVASLDDGTSADADQVRFACHAWKI